MNITTIPRRFKKLAHITRNAQRAFSLVELLVAMSLGLFVMAGAITMYTYIISLNTSHLQRIRFEQSLDIAMYAITSNLRRAGFNGEADGENFQNKILEYAVYENSVKTDADKVGAYKKVVLNMPSGQNCIHFVYDKNANGKIKTNEFFAFKFDNNMIKRTNTATNTDTKCNTSTQWEDMMDPNFVNVSDFNVELKTNETHVYIITITANIKGNTNSARTIKKVVTIRNKYGKFYSNTLQATTTP